MCNFSTDSLDEWLSPCWCAQALEANKSPGWRYCRWGSHKDAPLLSPLNTTCFSSHSETCERGKAVQLLPALAHPRLRSGASLQGAQTYTNQLERVTAERRCSDKDFSVRQPHERGCGPGLAPQASTDTQAHGIVTALGPLAASAGVGSRLTSCRSVDTRGVVRCCSCCLTQYRKLELNVTAAHSQTNT